MECPNCKGVGYSMGYGCPGFKLMKIDCDICKGTGELPESVQYRPEHAANIKAIRKNERKTLREAAAERGITAVELSRQERGFFNK